MKDGKRTKNIWNIVSDIEKEAENMGQIQKHRNRERWNGGENV